MTIEVDYDDLANALDWAGVDGKVRPDYSGRGMYGDTCVGLILDYDSDYTRFVKYLTRAVLEEEEEQDHPLYALYERLEDVSTDSMGRHGIWYWPGVKVINVPEED